DAQDRALGITKAIASQRPSDERPHVRVGIVAVPADDTACLAGAGAGWYRQGVDRNTDAGNIGCNQPALERCSADFLTQQLQRVAGPLAVSSQHERATLVVMLKIAAEG